MTTALAVHAGARLHGAEEYDAGAGALRRLHRHAARPACPTPTSTAARCSTALNRFDDAAAPCRAALAQNVPLNERRVSYLAQAQDYERNGNLTAGYPQLQPANRGLDLLRRYRRRPATHRGAEEAAGRPDRPASTQNRLLLNYPGTTRRWRSFGRCWPPAKPSRPTSAASIYYRHNNYDSAEIAFKEQLTDCARRPCQRRVRLLPRRDQRIARQDLRRRRRLRQDACSSTPTAVSPTTRCGGAAASSRTTRSSTTRA